MSSFDYDYLIVGQGLAGSTLAFHLTELGKKVLVVGDSSLPSSSRVAAGIFNPLTGKKLVKTWLADDIFPYAQTFYKGLEHKFGQEFLHETPIFRPYRSIEEQNTYHAQAGEPGILPYVGTSAPDLSAYIHMPYGGLEVVRVGWVDLPAFLDASKAWLKEIDSYTDERFDATELDPERMDGIVWRGHTFGKVVLCQGFEAVNNVFFDWLPFAPVKGEILEVATDVSLKEYIVNQGIFMLPLGNGRARVGATYAWHNLNWEVTEGARNELTEKFSQLFSQTFSVQGQLAGIRPSSQDRRPMIGQHPAYANLYVFNGLGTKGVTLAPFFSNQLAQHLEMGKELSPLVNIKRYFSLYFR